MKTKQIVIIGAGVSGLVAAINCEQAGFHPILIDADKQIGGRTQSITKDGEVLDNGFQVLLTEYTTVKKYLDLPSLHLKYFTPGAFVFKGRKEYELSDPLRHWWKLPNMIFSGIGTLMDKWHIFTLSRKLKNEAEERFFDGNTQSTLEFLKSYGFSDRIIHLFFKPFFSGIFLEDRLETPASMFQFVFGKFSKGQAAIPEKGIQEIPNQLFKKLKNTTLLLNKKVERVEDHELIFEDGETMGFDRLIVATDGQYLFEQGFEKIPYHHHIQYYFKTDRPLLGKKIGLFADDTSDILTVAALGELKGIKKGGRGYLLSVTLKKEIDYDQLAIYKLIDDLRRFFKIPELPLTLVHFNFIGRALPVCSRFYYHRPLTDFIHAPNVFLAGDYLLNPSLDAAMRSGEMAVTALLSREQ
jgi:protoporphyrinogen oxidase